MLSYNSLAPYWLFVSPPTSVENSSQPQNEDLFFDIVESPQQAQPTPPDPNTHRLSNQTAGARDNAPESVPTIGDPYLAGQTELGTSAVPATEANPTPEPTAPDPASADNSEISRTLIREDFGEIMTGKTDRDSTRKKGMASVANGEAAFKNVVSKSNARGDFSFSTYDFDWYDYAARLKQRIRENWYVPDAFRKFGLISGRTLVSFTIWPDGSVTNLRVLAHDGDKSLENSSYSAVRSAAPFDRLPPDFPKDRLDITFAFYYIIDGKEMPMFDLNATPSK